MLVNFTELKQQEQRESSESVPVVDMEDREMHEPWTPITGAPTMATSGTVLLAELVRVAGQVLVEKRKALNTAESNNQTMKNMQQMFKSLIPGGGPPSELPPWKHSGAVAATELMSAQSNLATVLSREGVTCYEVECALQRYTAALFAAHNYAHRLLHAPKWSPKKSQADTKGGE